MSIFRNLLLKTAIPAAVLLFCCSGVQADSCDFDGDGISDPVTLESIIDPANRQVISKKWNIQNSADSSVSVVSNFGDANGYAVPANFVETGKAVPAYISVGNGFRWFIRLNNDITVNSLNFGFNGVSFVAGHDFNGDGFDDAMKVIDSCDRLKATCVKRPSRYNVIYNTPGFDSPGSSTVKPFQDISKIFAFNQGKKASAIFVADIDGDLKDDLCTAKPQRRNKKVFRAKCVNVLTRAKVATVRLGRIHNLPLKVRVNGADQVIVWKARNRRGDTRIRLINPLANTVEKFFIAGTGTLAVADYMGLGNEQIAIQNGSQLSIYDPVSKALLQTRQLEAGEIIDCQNNIYGASSEVYLTSRNVCKVLDC